MEFSEPHQCAAFVRSKIDDIQGQEEVHVLCFNSNRDLLGHKMIHRGTADECPVHPRDVFRFAIACNAISIVLAHNHPSNDKRPSKLDIDMTKKMRSAGKLLQIVVDDHIIVTKDGHYSFFENKI